MSRSRPGLPIRVPRCPLDGRWNATNKAALLSALRAPRNRTLFYAGTIFDKNPDDSAGRGGIYTHHVNRTGYLVARVGEHPRVPFPATMRVRLCCCWDHARSLQERCLHVGALC